MEEIKKERKKQTIKISFSIYAIVERKNRSFFVVEIFYMESESYSKLQIHAAIFGFVSINKMLSIGTENL